MSKILKVKVDQLYNIAQNFIVEKEIEKLPDNIKNSVRNIARFGDEDGYDGYVLNYNSGLLETTSFLKNKHNEKCIPLEGYFVADIKLKENGIHYISLYDKDYNEYIKDGKSILLLGEDYTIESI